MVEEYSEELRGQGVSEERVEQAVEELGFLEKFRGEVAEVGDWATHPKRKEGFKLLGEGILEVFQGSAQTVVGSACVGSGFAVGGVGGVITTAACGGTVGLGVNNLFEGGTKIGTAIDNVLSRDEEIRNGSIDLIEGGINVTTEEGSRSNIALHGLHIVADTASTGYSIKNIQNIKNAVVFKAGVDVTIGLSGQAVEDWAIGERSSPVEYFGVGAGGAVDSFLGSAGSPDWFSAPVGGFVQEGVKDLLGEEPDYSREIITEFSTSLIPGPKGEITSVMVNEGYNVAVEVGIDLISKSQLLEPALKVTIGDSSLSYDSLVDVNPTYLIGESIDDLDLELDQDKVNEFLKSYRENTLQ